MRIDNPYAGAEGPWLRGNLHTHSTNSDGSRTPSEIVAAYAALGYNFLMFSDHDFFTDPLTVDAREMVLLPGVEVSAWGPHIVHVGATRAVEPAKDRQAVLSAIQADRGFAIVAHPNWEAHFNHCPQALLEIWEGYTGIEVYNGVIRRLNGSPRATDRWDRLLGLGRRVWGFAHDDSHTVGDDGLAWNMVCVAERSPNAIIDALSRGACYASTGVIIREIAVTGDTIRVETENAQRIVIHSDFGHRECATDGAVAAYCLPETNPPRYVRFECWGQGDDMAWTQPFFIEAE